VIDRVVTTTQVDLTFARVKRKGERKIAFDEFLQGLASLAAMKFPGDPEGFDRIVAQVLEARGPASSATTAVDTAGGVFSKLTDHTQYTGAHKARFDAATGAGRGLDGRDTGAVGAGTAHGVYHGGAVADLSQITRGGMRLGGTHLHAAPAAGAGQVSAYVLASPPAASAVAAAHSARGAAAPAAGSHEHYKHSPSATTAAEELGYTLFDVFMAYCSFGGTSSVADEMDNGAGDAGLLPSTVAARLPLEHAFL